MYTSRTVTSYPSCGYSIHDSSSSSSSLPARWLIMTSIPVFLSRCLSSQCLSHQARLPPGWPLLDRLRRVGALLPPLLEQPLHGGGVQSVLPASLLLSTPGPGCRAEKMVEDSLLFSLSADASRRDYADIHFTLFPFLWREVTGNLLWPWLLVHSL